MCLILGLLKQIADAAVYIGLGLIRRRSIIFGLGFLRMSMLALLRFLRGRLRFAGLIVTEMTDISFYTTCTWALLCNGKKVSHRALSMTSGCIYWKGVVPNRKSYAAQVPDRISFCQTRCAYAQLPRPPLSILTQCSTYGSSTVHTSCENTF